MVEKIKVALVGIGNCFSGLIQGIEYYKQNPSQEVIGIIHEKLRDSNPPDFDIFSKILSIGRPSVMEIS